MASKEYVKHFFKKWSSYIVCTPFLLRGWVPTKFSKKGPDRISIFRGRLQEKRGWLFWAGGGRDRSWYVKNKLKSGILNDEKNYKPKCLSAITKNLNWQILTKNLVTFKRSDGLKMENVDIMQVHQFLGERVTKKQLYMGNWLKRGAWIICRGLGKK